MNCMWPIWPLSAHCDKCDKRVGGSKALCGATEASVYCKTCAPPGVYYEWNEWPDDSKPPTEVVIK